MTCSLVVSERIVNNLSASTVDDTLFSATDLPEGQKGNGHQKLRMK